MTGMEHPVALLRLREHLTVEELAERAGVPEVTILAIEAGEVPVSVVVAGQLAAPLGVEAATLLASAGRFEERAA